MSEKADSVSEEKRKTCPRCGSDRVIPIRYGYPSEKMRHEASLGRILLGGCVIVPGLPGWHCRDCGHKW